jgi:hypothetical protein
VIGLLRADEAMHRRYLRSVSVAKKAAAFLRFLPLLAELAVLPTQLAKLGALLGG